MLRKIRVLSLALTVSFAAASYGDGGVPVAPAEAPAEAVPAEAAEADPRGQPVIPPGFEPISGKEARAEQVDANGLVVAAYLTIFVLMFGFVLYVVRAQAAMSREMAELADRLSREKRG